MNDPIEFSARVSRKTLLDNYSPRNSFIVPPKRLKPVVGAFGVSEGEDSGAATNAPSSPISAPNSAIVEPNQTAQQGQEGSLRLDLSSLNLPSPRLSVKPNGPNQATIRLDLEDQMRQTNPRQTQPSVTPPQQTSASPAASLGQPAQGVNQSVVERIMQSEGVSATQSGLKEYFGFRENHPAFNTVKNAVTQFGPTSPQTKEVVGALIRQRASTVGADKFKDAGVQGAVMSIAHMRGEGGAQAILNSVAGAPIKKSGKLTNETINAINSMDPREFQEKLRVVREQYDKQIYGDKKDSVVTNGKTVTGRWWDLFGKGLINRYEREKQEFTALSQSARGASPEIAFRKK